MQPKEYPILEYDPERRAVIEPAEVYKTADIAAHCVICFFKDIVDQVVASSSAKIIFEDKGEYRTNRFYQIQHQGRPVVFFQPLVGAAVAAAFLEIAIALGCRKFVACGAAGVLDGNIPVGGFIVPTAAIRDEGVSYHYAPPGREIDADSQAIKAIASTLDRHGEQYRLAKTWTTDGLFRETPAKVARRKREGCLTVEMEAAALFAVAKFRGVPLGYILSGGDDVSGREWDRRGDISRLPTRERLFWLSLEACLKL
jgi:uridine phosphorylase